MRGAFVFGARHWRVARKPGFVSGWARGQVQPRRDELLRLLRMAGTAAASLKHRRKRGRSSAAGEKRYFVTASLPRLLQRGPGLWPYRQARPRGAGAQHLAPRGSKFHPSCSTEHALRRNIHLTRRVRALSRPSLRHREKGAAACLSAPDPAAKQALEVRCWLWPLHPRNNPRGPDQQLACSTGLGGCPLSFSPPSSCLRPSEASHSLTVVLLWCREFPSDQQQANFSASSQCWAVQQVMLQQRLPALLSVLDAGEVL